MHKFLLTTLFLIVNLGFTQNLYIFKENGLYGYINKEEKILIPAKFTFAKRFSSDGLAKVIEPNKKFGFINKKGEYVLPPQYTLTSSFHNHKAIIFKND